MSKVETASEHNSSRRILLNTRRLDLLTSFTPPHQKFYATDRSKAVILCGSLCCLFLCQFYTVSPSMFLDDFKLGSHGATF